jgi:Zn-dependent protease
MFGRSISLFKLAGFEVRIDGSWIFFALLITWSLADGYFPSLYPGLPPSLYWGMGIAGLIGLAVSIVLHELAHSLVARSYELPVRGITLFIFGGVAEMDGEPRDPKAEFLMAIAGPIVSLILAGIFYSIALTAATLAVPGLPGVALYLTYLNLVLAIFNMVPAFPLDGGRVLRAALWWGTGDFRRATRAAVISGYIFSAVLIALGVISVLAGNVVRGLWWLLLGTFLAGAARSSQYRGDEIHRA